MQALLYNIELSAADYMDSHAECGKTFELGLTPATVYGKGAVQTSDSPLSCTIILSTDGIREHRRFSIELVTGFISSQGVNFYIYDGQWTQNSGAQTLVSCFCHQCQIFKLQTACILKIILKMSEVLSPLLAVAWSYSNNGLRTPDDVERMSQNRS